MSIGRFTISTVCMIIVSGAISASDAAPLGSANGEFQPASHCSSGAVTPARLNINLDLQDYGRVFLDSGLPECAALAADILRSKLEGVFEESSYEDELGRWVEPFQGWLEGAHVALIFSSALQLGGRQELNAALDEQLHRLKSSYQFAIDPGCGPNFRNECIDDYAQAANAFAWIAAYETKSGREGRARGFAGRSTAALSEALSIRNHMCKVRHDDSLPAPCEQFDRALDGLASSYLEIVSFNHGFQNVAYGVGLLPALSGAAVGLEIAEHPFEPSEENRVVADALFVEGQRAAFPDGSDFRADCYRIEDDILLRDSPCVDALNKLPSTDPLYDPNFYYLPRMFPVSAFFERVFGVAPNSDPYRFDEFDSDLFNNPFLNAGRLATYGYLGYLWWNPAGSTVLRPALEGFPRSRTRPVRR